MGAALHRFCCTDPREEDDHTEDLVASHQSHAEAQAKLLAVWDQLLLAQSNKDTVHSRRAQWTPRCCPVVGPVRSSCLYSLDQALDSDADWCKPSVSTTAPSEAVCGLIRAEWLENRYSGLFQKADYGLARFSMMRPYRLDSWHHFVPSAFFGESLDQGQCAPAIALKFFRGGQAPSGNLLLVGQPSIDKDGGLGQCLCSQSAQVGCDGADSNPLLSRHSAWPHATGLSAFAALGQDGRQTRGGLNGEVVECPWALILQPVSHMPPAPAGRRFPGGQAALAQALQRMLQTQPGTTLYEVYACPSPGAAFESGWLQLIGRIVSASKFILEPVSENLHQLRFRHQKKEEDYVLRPEWLQELNPSHNACGSEHFTRLLERQQRNFSGQGGAFVADTLPSSRWIWSVGMKAQEGLSSFPRSISTSATAVDSSRTTSPASTARSTSRDSLAAALRQRGGRASPSPQAVKEASPKEAKTSGSSGWPTSFYIAFAITLFVLAPLFQQEASEGSIRAHTIAMLLVIFLSCRSCSKRRFRDEEDEQWEDCFQEVAHEVSRRSEPWRQELSREPVLVRGVSAHELLLT